jgi:hypothetical protein
MEMSQPFSGSIFRQRCIDVQDRLSPHFAQIFQPHGVPSEDERHLPSSSRELQSLARTGEYILYSDDALLRFWILGDKFASDGMCTLDLLCALEETSLLTTQDVGVKLAQLADWHVGIQIQLRHQLALIPKAVHSVPSVLEAAAMLRDVAPFMSLARGLWGPHTDFIPGLSHIGAVIRLLVQDPAITDVAIGAFVMAWIDQATARTDMRLPALRLTVHIVVHAVVAEKLPIEAVRRLWNVYFSVIEAVHDASDEKVYALALALVAQEAGVLDKRMEKERVAQQSRIGERLMMGLDPNSNAWVAFSAAYIVAYK